jgi:RHS repeat-associated protein
VLTYLHGDHLGSTSLVTNDAGGFVARVLYYPYGEERYHEGTLTTDYAYTGQRKEGFGLYDYRARFYDPALGRFASADTIVPGAASGAGGGLGTISYSDQTRLTPLTVGFHKTQFLQVLNAENQELLEFGQPALWSKRTRQEHNTPMGPINPQALDRYAYCLNNPMRYVDPTGHTAWKRYQVVTHDAWGVYAARLTQHSNGIAKRARNWGWGACIVGAGITAALTWESGPFVIGFAAAGGAASGFVTEQLAGGVDVDALQGFVDYISTASAELENHGVTEFRIAMLQRLDGADVWVEYYDEDLGAWVHYRSEYVDGYYYAPWYILDDLGMLNESVPGSEVTIIPD